MMLTFFLEIAFSDRILFLIVNGKIIHKCPFPQLLQILNKMVFLSYSFLVKAPLVSVWNYFSKFEKIAEWDPNVKTSKISNLTKNMVGSTYDLVTVWKGKESDIVYTIKEYVENKKLKIIGKNAVITAVDEISFEDKDGATKVTYSADITLNHIFCLMTPFIKSDLEKLAKQAQDGMKKKAEELFSA